MKRDRIGSNGSVGSGDLHLSRLLPDFSFLRIRLDHVALTHDSPFLSGLQQKGAIFGYTLKYSFPCPDGVSSSLRAKVIIRASSFSSNGIFFRHKRVNLVNLHADVIPFWSTASLVLELEVQLNVQGKHSTRPLARCTVPLEDLILPPFAISRDYDFLGAQFTGSALVKIDLGSKQRTLMARLERWRGETEGGRAADATFTEPPARHTLSRSGSRCRGLYVPDEELARLWNRKEGLMWNPRLTKHKKSEMAGDLLNMLDDGTEERGETSFMDLPDDILINIFEHLDFRSRLKLRVNRRLDKLQFGVKNHIDRFKLKINSNDCELTVSRGLRTFSILPCDYNHLEMGLGRLAINTSFEDIIVYLSDNLNKGNTRLFNAVIKLDADQLEVSPDTYLMSIDLPQVNLSTLLVLSQNVGNVELFIKCSSLTAHDLCTFRKIILGVDCKLKRFCVDLDEEITKSFMKVCFGVAIEEVSEPVRRKIYSSENESVELYTDDDDHEWLSHFEDDLITGVRIDCIVFEICAIKPGNQDIKIQLNHFYQLQGDSS